MEYWKAVLLKDGTECLLRNAIEQDARQMLDHLRQSAEETDFLLRYADEVTMTEQQEAEYIEAQRRETRSVLLVAVINGRLVATGGLGPVGLAERVAHRAALGLAVQKDYWQKGVGSALLVACIGLAGQAGFEQVELEVAADNQRALSLYEKQGFLSYGVRPSSLRYRDGSYRAEKLMILGL